MSYLLTKLDNNGRSRDVIGAPKIHVTWRTRPFHRWFVIHALVLSIGWTLLPNLKCLSPPITNLWNSYKIQSYKMWKMGV